VGLHLGNLDHQELNFLCKITSWVANRFLGDLKNLKKATSFCLSVLRSEVLDSFKHQSRTFMGYLPLLEMVESVLMMATCVPMQYTASTSSDQTVEFA